MNRRPRLGALPPGLDRDELVAAVGEGLGPVPADSRVVLALSGGPDSTGLAALTLSARADLVVLAGHVRHGLRDDTPDAGAARGTAERLGFRFAAESVTVSVGRDGPESAARRARYAALEGMAAAHGARFVLLGHTADDQAETVLLNLGRGAGSAGLGGMRPLRPLGIGGLALVRPVLRVRRADVRRVADETGLPWIADPTNADPEQRRARVRTTLLPALAAVSGGPGDAVRMLTRTADLARADADALDAFAAEHADRLIFRSGSVAGVPSEGLAALPQALATRVVRQLIAQVRGGLSGLDAEAVHRALALRPGESMHAPGGVVVTAEQGSLNVAPLATPPPRPASGRFTASGSLPR